MTYSRLWQLKEWRLDRLREYIKEEGVWATFLSFGRVLLGILCILAAIATNAPEPFLIAGVLAAAGILQIILRKQPYPVWTTKAKMIVGLSVVTNAVILLLADHYSPFSILHSPFVVVLPYLQPLVVTIAWVLLFPVDRYLKRRIMDRARRLRDRHPDLTVIGITGSVGKTTTKELIAHILSGKQSVLVTPEHVNTEMGVSQWIIQALANRKSQIAIVEMGAYRRGEIALLCSIAKPSIGVLTHIGSQHVGLFGSLEHLREAKTELLMSLPGDGQAFVNGDCAPCREAAKRAQCPVTLVGTGGHLDLEAFEIEERPEGIRFRVNGTTVDVALHGTHNVSNVLLAIAVARHLGLDMAVIATRLRSFAAPSKTFRVRTERSVTILDDTHNASEASMEAAIAWARTRPEKQKILVTPGLIELGEMEERTHEKLGALAKGVFDDVLFTNKKSAQHFARGYGKNVHMISEWKQRVQPGSLLVCVGRMPTGVMEKLLPLTSPLPRGEGNMVASETPL